MEIPQTSAWKLFKIDFKRKVLGFEYVDIMMPHEKAPTLKYRTYLRVKTTRDGRRWVNRGLTQRDNGWALLHEDGSLSGDTICTHWRKSP